jgi:hypothetical protein
MLIADIKGRMNKSSKGFLNRSADIKMQTIYQQIEGKPGTFELQAKWSDFVNINPEKK